MDSEVLAALLGVFGTIIVGLLGLCGILVRRNGKQEPHNPNFETLTMLMKQVLDATQSMDHNIDGMREILVEMKTVIGRCPIPGQGGQ
ncbi:hypothetical protein LCGC14_0444940 [marine sediment metagenome]|uniref:Uncharacterized protein n=1 Tax=marine sediment metagenome TaxID=412755 RepID=A0A0F9T2G5_9ZZZZ